MFDDLEEDEGAPPDTAPVLPWMGWVCWAAVVGLAVLLAGCGPQTEQRPEVQRMLLIRAELLIDPVSGCEYLVAYDKAITPRIAADGKTHMGCKGPAQ